MMIGGTLYNLMVNYHMVEFSGLTKFGAVVMRLTKMVMIMFLLMVAKMVMIVLLRMMMMTVTYQ